MDGSAPTAGDAARLTVWLSGSDLSGAPLTVSGATEERASLPANLRLQPPDSMSKVDSVSVQLLDGPLADDPRGSGSLLLAGHTQLDWPSGARIEATVNLEPPSVPYSRRVDLLVTPGGNPRSVVALDVDHNGQMDLVVRNESTDGDSIFLMLANADGSFQAGQTICPRKTGRSLTNPAVADLNKDGNADVAVADTKTGDLFVYYGRGDGSFPLPARFYSRLKFPGMLSAADLNADGWGDLLFAGTFGEISVYWNAAGVFGEPTVLNEGGTNPIPSHLGSPALIDLNGDQRLDVVVTSPDAKNSIKIWKNNGERVFSFPITVDNLADSVFAIAARDFDGDTKVDLVTAEATTSGRLQFLKGDGSGQLAVNPAQALDHPTLLALAADLNGDFIPDLAFADASTVRIALGNGLGGFQRMACPGPETDALCQLPGRAVFATAQDLNGDGMPELLFVTEAGAGSPGKVSILGNAVMDNPQPLIDHRSPNLLRDNFTVETGNRTNPSYGANSTGQYVIEQSILQPVWTPFNFTMVAPPRSKDPTLVQAATGNLGAAGGIVEIGITDASIQFTDTTGSYVVQADAILPDDRFNISSMPYPGALRATANSLNVQLRRDTNVFNKAGIGLYDGTTETTTGCKTGITSTDNNWHNFAVNFQRSAGKLVIYVDGKVKCNLDLNSFAGGIYKNYSSAAVGMGAGRSNSSITTWVDNFYAGPALSPQ